MCSMFIHLYVLNKSENATPEFLATSKANESVSE